MTTLPDGWRLSKIGELFKVRYGKALSKDLRLQEGPFPVVGSAGVMAHTSTALATEPSIVIGRKGNVGESRYFPNGCWPIDTTYFVHVPTDYAGRFIELLLEAHELRHLDSSTTTPSLRRQDLEAVEIRIPPIDEQHEIVRILDTQLARLDSVLGAVQAVRDKAAQFRRSLLRDAFNGQLTQPDAARGDTLPDDWRSMSVAEVTTEIKSGFASGRHNSKSDGIPHLRPMNVSRDGRLDLSQVKYIAGEAKQLLAEGDILFNNTNSADLVGKTAYVDRDDVFAFSNHMTRVRADTSVVEPQFLATQLHWNWMNGFFKSICSNHVNQASIATKRLSTVDVCAPPLDEQDEIVRILDAQLSRLDDVLRVADRVELECGRLRRSLLQAAFSGVLTREWRESRV